MLHNNLQLFNVAQFQETNGGVRLFRYPQKVIDALAVPEFDEQGNFVQTYSGHQASARTCVGIEIRFFCDSDEIAFDLESESSISVSVYSGDYQVANLHKPVGRHSFTVKRNASVKGAKEINRFSAEMWRILPVSDTPVTLYGIETQTPILPFVFSTAPTMLVYGSSISQGCGAPYGLFPYVDVAGNVLGYQVKNKAIAGGCFCEKEVLEYLKSENFDIAYFELGTNIANRPIEIIEERVGGFIDSFCKAFPKKRLFFATPVKGFDDVSEQSIPYGRYFANARKVITERAEKYPNAFLIDGHELSKKAYYMSADVLHPSGFGHIMMGLNLAEFIKKV